MKDTTGNPHAMKAHLVPIPETCHALGGIARSTVYELIDRGELVRVRIGVRALITADSIEAYLERLKAAAKAS